MPVPHFGVALEVPQFQALAERCRGAGIQFVIEPHLRFQGAWHPHDAPALPGL